MLLAAWSWLSHGEGRGWGWRMPEPLSSPSARINTTFRLPASRGCHSPHACARWASGGSGGPCALHHSAVSPLSPTSLPAIYTPAPYADPSCCPTVPPKPSSHSGVPVGFTPLQRESSAHGCLCHGPAGTHPPYVLQQVSPQGSVPAWASNCPHRAAGSFGAVPLSTSLPATSSVGEAQHGGVGGGGGSRFNELPGGIAAHPPPVPGNRRSETQPLGGRAGKKPQGTLLSPRSFPASPSFLLSCRCQRPSRALVLSLAAAAADFRCKPLCLEGPERGILGRGD